MRRQFEDLSYNLRDDDMVPDLGSPRGFVGSVLASYVPGQENVCIMAAVSSGGLVSSRGRFFRHRDGPLRSVQALSRQVVHRSIGGVTAWV